MTTNKSSNSNRNWLISLSILIILALAPFVAYIVRFWHHKILAVPENWGAFGDFFGGVFSVFSFLATVYIAYQVSNFDRKRSQEALRFEKTRFLNELREAEYRRINAELEKIYFLKKDKSICDHTNVFSNQVAIFINTNTHLFPFLNDKKSEGYKICEKLLNSFVDLNSAATWFYIDGRDRMDGEEEVKLKKAMDKALLEARFTINEFTGLIQRFIIGEMDQSI